MMNTEIPIVRDAENQRPVPSAWRDTFRQIVAAFKVGDFQIKSGVQGVRAISERRANQIARSILNYGAHLTDLPDDAWETSACQWMESYWDVLIDLFTVEEGASDLAMVARVYEDEGAYSIDVLAVHVP